MKENEAIAYELIVKELFSKEMAKDCAINNLEFFHRKHFKGVDNNLYEIDIAFEFKMAHCKLLGIIECKNYSRPVGKGVVAEFITKKTQLNANFGLIVSPLGFQKGAINLAINEGIKLAQVCEYRYIPLVGDPTLQDDYFNRIVSYIHKKYKSYSKSLIETYLTDLDICSGNAYRAEGISEFKFQKKNYDSDFWSRIGFKLFTDDDSILIDKKYPFGKPHLLNKNM